MSGQSKVHKNSDLTVHNSENFKQDEISKIIKKWERCYGFKPHTIDALLKKILSE